MKNKIAYLDIQMKNKNMFELSSKTIEKIRENNLKIRLMNNKYILKSFRDRESISAIIAVAEDNNNRVLMSHLNDFIKTVRDAKFWNNKKIIAESGRLKNG